MTMRNATRITVSTFGFLAGVAGIEHGVGEVLQGNIALDSLVFESWAGSELFRVLAGEPAMSLISNLLVSGIASILVSLLFIVWVVWFIERKHAALVLLGLSILLLLVGGGFGPPLLGVILSAAATRINAPLRWWRAHGLRRSLAALWPWSLGAALIAWLLLFPGFIILDALVGMSDFEAVVFADMAAAFGLLFLTIAAAFARDSERGTAGAGAPALQRI